MHQGCLFPIPTEPEGFVYEPDCVSSAEQCALMEAIRELHFEPFLFHGYTAKRRIVVYGWDYDFESRETNTGREFPDFLLPLRERCAALIGVSGPELAEAVITEYPPSAPIGWHRDLPQFEHIVGISLLSSCTMRLRPWRATGKTFHIDLEQRSLYVMAGPARWQYEHSIPPVKKLRYSITFRTVRKGWTRQSESSAR